MCCFQKHTGSFKNYNPLFTTYFQTFAPCIMGHISVGNNRLHYQIWGAGKRLALAFHGYGNDAGMFLPIQEYTADQYTLLSFDLPHHGGSQWPQNTPLTQPQLTQLVQQLIQQYGVNKISLLGYSLGGRICLTIAASLPNAIDKMVLLATDGLTINSYYVFLTRTWLGRLVFRHLLTHPGPYFVIADFLERIKLLHPSRNAFVKKALRTPEKREMLLQVWPCLSELLPHPRTLKRTIAQYNMQLCIFMGVQDKIMPPRIARRFISGLDSARLIVLEKGHKIFDNETAQQIAGHLI